MNLRPCSLLAVVVLCTATALAVAAPTPPVPSGSATPTSSASPAPVLPTVEAANLRQAIERVASFLATRDLGGYDGWLLTQGARLLGRRFTAWAHTAKPAPALAQALAPGFKFTSFSEWLEKRWWDLRWLPERPMSALAVPKLAPADRTQLRQFEDKDVWSLGDFLYSVRCDTLKADDRGKWLEWLSAKPTHDYRLYFQLYSVMLGYNQGCLNSKVATPLRKELATRLLGEILADSDPLDALGIERTTALCYAQLCNWVPSSIVARLIAEQGPAGAWGPRDPKLTHIFRATRDHTAALGFYLLAHTWAVRFASQPPPHPPGETS